MYYLTLDNIEDYVTNHINKDKSIETEVSDTVEILNKLREELIKQNKLHTIHVREK